MSESSRTAEDLVSLFVQLLRQRGLLGRRSIVGWALLGVGIVWSVVNRASTIAWVWGIFHPSSPHPPASEASPASGWLIPIFLIIAAMVWLTAIVALPVLRPNVYGKVLRHNFVARNPYDDLTTSAIKAMRLTMGPTAHDYVVKLFLVNRSIWSTTVQRIEAEAEVDDVWIRLKAADVSHYVDEILQDEKYRNTGLRNVFSKKEPLPELWSTLRGAVLRRSIHYEGWLAFELMIEGEKLEGRKINFRLTIVDALDHRHRVYFDPKEVETDRMITYSPKAASIQ